MNFLLDTFVLSDFISNKPSKNLMQWLNSKNESHLYLSVLTIGEIQQGISKLNDSKRKLFLQQWLDNDVSKRFNGRIIPIDREIIDRWGRIRGTAMRKGKTLTVIYSLLAATAISHGMTIVTRNVDDMKATAVTVRNPWDDYK